ncbi:hypothetical protein PLICRDRAFT_162924 [Plicaturopsis crispa FD-325 SS-3]|nr:hypothetical protein PLICRDRAFT_162924 [Plicaturopsis crispa FD-325 SS-3]
MPPQRASRSVRRGNGHTSTPRPHSQTHGRRDYSASGEHALPPLPKTRLNKKQLGTPAPLNPVPSIPLHARPALQLWVWGDGGCGQFGLGHDTMNTNQTDFPKPRRNWWVDEQIQAGTFGAVGAGVESIAAGGMHTLFIDESGKVWSCGDNDNAALGRITSNQLHDSGSEIDTEELEALPHPIQTLVDENFRAVKVAAGDSISLRFSHTYHALHISWQSLTANGQVYCWGYGEVGELGHKILERHKTTSTVPYKILLGTRTRKAVAIGAGNHNSFAIDEQGDVWAWGLNSLGQAGTGLVDTDEEVVHCPKRVLGLSKKDLDGDVVVQIAGGEHHTLFLTAAGKVYACGRADWGQLGLPQNHDVFKNQDYKKAFVPRPTVVEVADADDAVVHIAAGTNSSMAVTRLGALYAWGGDSRNEMGLGRNDAPTPAVVVRKEGGSWSAVSVACGGQHTLGLFRKKA